MKKLISIIITILILSSLSISVFAADDGCIVRYTFKDAETGLQSEGMDTLLIGDINTVTFEDGVADFDGGVWLQGWPLDDRFQGLTEMTIAVKVKVDGVTPHQWPWELTSEFTHLFPHENYLGCRLDSGYLVERYSNMGERPAAASGTIPADEWMNLVSVFPEDGSILVYMNGELINEVPPTEGFDLALPNCIGDDPMLNIGKTAWGPELFCGEMDVLEVYNKALSADEVAALWVEIDDDDPSYAITVPETEAPETEAPETEAPETEIPTIEVPDTEAPETEAPKESGCNSAMGTAAIAVIVAVLGCALVTKH